MSEILGTRVTFLETCGMALKGETHIFYDAVLVSQLIADGKAELAEKKEILTKLVNIIRKKGNV